MGKKMKKFPFLFKPTTETTTTSSWPWPTCANNPKTLSFRANNANANNIYKTMNSAYLDDKNTVEFAVELTSDSFLSLCSSFEHHHHHQEACDLELQPKDEEPEVVISRALKSSDRLFFEPGETSSILEVRKDYDFPYNESVAIMAMDSTNPFVDFRISMEEMVAAHGLKDLVGLEELLTCYLRVNGKNNHGYIVGAFIDLLLNLDAASGSATTASASSNECSSSEAVVDERCSSSSTTTQYSFTSPLSFSSSTYSSAENEDEIVVVEKTVDSSSSSSSSSS